VKFARYIAVQLGAYGLDIGVYLGALLLFGSGALVANATGKISAGIFAFYTHRSFTFSAASEAEHGRQASLYFLVLSLNLPMSSAALWAMLSIFPSPVLAKVVADIVCVFITYWLVRRYVFSVDRNYPTVSSIKKRNIP